MNHMTLCDPGTSPFSPYYEDKGEDEIELCSMCFSEHKIKFMVQIKESWYCQDCLDIINTYEDEQDS